MYLLGRHRKHHELIYNNRGVTSCPIVVVLSNPVSPIYRTCRLIYSEAAPLLPTAIVPRIILDADLSFEAYMDRQFRIFYPLNELYLHILDCHNGFQLSLDRQEDSDNAWEDEEDDRIYSQFRDEDYPIIGKFARMAAAYLGRNQDATNLVAASSRRVQIAVRGRNEYSGANSRAQINRLLSIWSKQYGIPTIKYTVSERASPDAIAIGVGWLQYGGVISQANWETEWAEPEIY
jgi:hypothetical protein